MAAKGKPNPFAAKKGAAKPPMKGDKKGFVPFGKKK